MPQIKKFLLTILCILILPSPSLSPHTAEASSLAFVILSQYSAKADIGEEFYLLAVTSDLTLPTWKSSNSSVASVNTYGKVIAKKAGTATITAKIKKGEASCKVTVNKTKITLSTTNASIERGETLALTAVTSNRSSVTWKSSKKSIATIDERGVITGLKPGETTITATADGSNATCKLTVKLPSIKLSKSSVKLYRGNTCQLTATVSSGVRPTWKTNKKSVAVVDANGMITAIKHGTATITATVDGVEKRCEVIVNQPTITLSQTELTLKTGGTAALTAAVSSGNSAVWSTSNVNVVTVSEAGLVTAVKKGRAYIYASEDGVKVKCTVNVTE